MNITYNLEDIWKTKSPHKRQLAGILGFCFTNSYLAVRHFKEPALSHTDFKMRAANALVEFTLSLRENRLRSPNPSWEIDHHDLQKLQYSVPCYYCRHGYEESR